MKVKEIIDAIIVREGGYVHHPNDRGGPTKYGVTLKTLSEEYGRECTKDDVIALKKQEAFNIYNRKYYVLPGIDKLPELIQPVMLDMAVNTGPSRAIKLLQRALKIPEDGKVGPKTIMMANNACNPSLKEITLVNDITVERIKFYHSIVKNNPKQKVFLSGWINRANEFV